VCNPSYVVTEVLGQRLNSWGSNMSGSSSSSSMPIEEMSADEGQRKIYTMLASCGRRAESI
jgi:hypothetical protein